MRLFILRENKPDVVDLYDRRDPTAEKHYRLTPAPKNVTRRAASNRRRKRVGGCTVESARPGGPAFLDQG